MSVRIPCEQIERQLEWRYATKRFNPAKKIADRDWQVLEQSLILAPSSFGLQPWHLVTVSDLGLRQALREQSWNQPQVVEASHFIVLAAKTSIDQSYVDAFIKRAAAVRNVSEASLDGYRGMINGFLSTLAAPGAAPGAVESWCTNQLYIALGMLLTSAAMLGVDACPLEGIDRAAYDSALGLPAQGVSAKVAVALGYRADDDALASLSKVRLPSENVFSRR